MLKLIEAEFFKLKRSKLFLIVILGTVFPGFCMFSGLIIGNVGPISMSAFLDEINLYSLTLFNIIVYALLLAYLFVREYNEHTLKSILTVPISKNSYIAGKFITFELLVIFLTIFNYVLSVIFGYLGGASDITINIIGEYFLKFLVGNALLSITLTPFILISLLFKSIVPTVIGGAVVSFSNSIIFGNAYAPLSPFCTPILIVSNELSSYSYGTAMPIAILFGCAAIGLLLSVIYFRRSDVVL